MLGAYALRVYVVRGWFIVTYGLGIFMLNNFIGFLSPQTDPAGDGPLLPMAVEDDYKPFARRMPEFKFWCSSTKGVLVAFAMTFFSVFDAFIRAQTIIFKSPLFGCSRKSFVAGARLLAQCGAAPCRRASEST